MGVNSGTGEVFITDNSHAREEKRLEKVQGEETMMKIEVGHIKNSGHHANNGVPMRV